MPCSPTSGLFRAAGKAYGAAFSGKRANTADGQPFIRWLRARFKIAADLNGRRRLGAKELGRAELDAAFGRYTGPLRLEDGSYLAAEDAVAERRLAEAERDYGRRD